MEQFVGCPGGVQGITVDQEIWWLGGMATAALKWE